MIEQHLSLAEAAKALGVTWAHAQRLLKNNSFPKAYQVNYTGFWRIPITDIQAYKSNFVDKRKVRNGKEKQSEH